MYHFVIAILLCLANCGTVNSMHCSATYMYMTVSCLIRRAL